MMSSHHPIAWLTLLTLSAVAGVHGPAAAESIDFERDVRPIFQRHCYACHGPEKQTHGLRLDRRAALLRGGDSGEPSLIPGNAQDSHMIHLVSGKDAQRRMPYERDPLTADEIDVVRTWIDEGAAMPEAADPEADELSTDLWSFRPIPRKIRPPDVDDRWGNNDIDRFILAKLKEKGLAPNREADKRTLIRRLYFDMHGLPPTPEQVESFIHDPSPDAWANLVERVLASPRYGERWGQHWLDVARYADTHGFEMNQPRPNAWPYRDYVIGAFNEDKPYDQFLFEQIAGDAMGTDTATGFLVAGAWDQVKSPDVGLTLMQRADELADMVNTTSTAFLGLTIACARCHNHKFDPVTQADYYAFEAVFAGVSHGERSVDPHSAPRTTPVNAIRNVERFSPVEARLIRFTVHTTSDGNQPGIDELEVFAAGTQENVALASDGAKATASGVLPGYPMHQIRHINDGRHGNDYSWISNKPGVGWIQIELPRLTQIDRIEWGRDREGRFGDRLPVGFTIEVATEPGAWKTIISVRPGQMVYAGVFSQPQPTRRLFRGDPLAPRELIAPDGLLVLRARLGSFEMSPDAPEQNRRVALANWLTHPDHPLTSRVIVNRIWQWHFGKGLVATSSDLGAMGVQPTHPELLDWLARRFIEDGWSIKQLHRLILLSSTYRQDSRPRPEALKVDADAHYLWRFPPRRLEAEAIRDSMLSVAGTLDLTMGGPGFEVFEPNENYVRVYEPRQEWGPAQWRRMIYAHKVRMEQDGTFGVFDCPDAGQSTARRNSSTTALQALNLLNSTFVLQQAELFAQRLRQEAGPDAEDQIDLAFTLALGRVLDRDARNAALQLVHEHGLPPLCRAIFNTNEFLTMP